MFNHSCSPNVCRVRRGRDLVFVALEDVKEGDELCISYVPSNQGRDERRAVLQRHFGFDCTCPLCMCDTAAGGPNAGDEGGASRKGHDHCWGFWYPLSVRGAECDEGREKCSICGDEREGTIITSQ
jgi:hypothetical protein